MSDPDLPRYHRSAEVPRDLRSAEELAQRGYVDLGAQRAVLVTAGGEVALYSTSEARRRRDPLWARRSGTEQQREERDLVGTVAQRRVPPSGRPRSGRCSRCGREAFGLVEGRCPACRRANRETVLRDATSGWVERLFASDFVVLDTETTGLGRRDEIIEVGVVDAEGRALLETRVWPRSGHVPEGARRIHGLGIDDLRGAPTWPAVLPELSAILAGRRVLAWNAPFDERMAQQSSRLWRVRHDLPAFECAMRAYALACGVASGRRKLQTAAVEQGVATGPQEHRSADDARLSLAVLRSLAAGPGPTAGAGAGTGNGS